MAAELSPSGGANLDSDPELQALTAELKQSLQNLQAEIEPGIAQMKADEAASLANAPPSVASSPTAEPLPDPDFHQLENALPEAAHAEMAHQPGEKVHEIYEFAEKVVEEIVEHRHHRKQSKEQQWYYARGNERVGPVPQSELLKLFEKDELPLTTLVWHRPMKEWKPASETELAKLADAGAPPPLPGQVQPTAPPRRADGQVCPSCGHKAKVGERFCAECGVAL